ncbi:exonuclease [Romboutsia ilealis]|uniref:Exonuclease n=1 Tax=Romboutsia faecis TaxID=2764597 RepID=A0ABR7JNN4_9FIRM|nr:helicase C-terminal domain-containing protein [Romboutsia faecis]MBC5996338.1 exonuclease [Romboutsia faecis]MRN25021.1 exonuclease [Romboutsia ilealis]
MEGITDIIKIKNNIISVLDNVVFLDIETSGLNPSKSEIIEIGAIKIEGTNKFTFETLIKNKREIPLEIFSLCTGLKKEDFKNALELNIVKKKLIEFVEDKTIICHNALFEKSFFDIYIPELKNEIIDSMELAAILEPYHREFNLDYLKKTITNDKKNESHRALDDAMDTIKIVNSLLMRLNKEESEITLEPLSFKINSYLNKFGLPNWNWSKHIDNGNYNVSDDCVRYKNDKNNNIKRDNEKEKEVFNKIHSKHSPYEDLLKDESIWANKEGFIYEFRPGQHELTKTIRETFRGNSGSAKVACIEAPTGIGKSVGYLLPAILEARLRSQRIIISTDTKELQTQLINKDIPNILNSLGLNNKVSYGYIKGKNNYICVEKLEGYKSDYTSEDTTVLDVLGIIYLERLVEEGNYGDIEEINYWVINHFAGIENHIIYASCDPNLCRPKKCIKNCLYKRRVEELKEEDITVINHSLLAKWPYKEEKPIENLIVDEAHNLTEKGYEFFSSIVDSRSFKYFLQEMYPYENIYNSPFAYNKKLRKMKMFDKFYNHIRLDRTQKDKISTNINLIVQEIDSLLMYGESSDYKNASMYNLRWELNLQENDVASKVRKDNDYISLTYKAYTDRVKLSCETIIRNLSSMLVIIDRNMDDDSCDKESDIYKFGKSRFMDMECIKTTMQAFLEYSEEDEVARIVDIDRDFRHFEFRVVPLNLADLFEENILSTLSSGIFLSATLSIGNKMDYFKRALGINRVGNVEKIIDPIYDYKKRLSVISINDISSYKNDNFIDDMSEIISDICDITNGHTLCLFNSKDRQKKTYDILKGYLHEKDIEIYNDKKGIKVLKNIDKKCVVLGSKGCFEGVDVPGDGLICATMDKIPNLNPKDPLYSTIMHKYNIPYHAINYPQLAIKVKQALGRILRSKYDYGCFVIFNSGSNLATLRMLERDLHGCKILSMNRANMYKNIESHLKKSRQEVIKSAIIDISKSLKNINFEDMKKVEEYINKEIKNRTLMSRVQYMNNFEKTFKIKYFDITYLINKDKLI